MTTLENNPFSEIARRLAFIESKLTVPDTNAPPEILNIETLQKYLLPGVPTGTIYQWSCKKLIPKFRVGRRLYFKRSEIESWLNDKRRPTVQERVELAVTKPNK